MSSSSSFFYCCFQLNVAACISVGIAAFQTRVVTAIVIKHLSPGAFLSGAADTGCCSNARIHFERGELFNMQQLSRVVLPHWPQKLLAFSQQSK